MFRDLGDPLTALKQAQATLAALIMNVPDDGGLSVRKTGALPRSLAADFARIRHADVGRHMLDRLMRMLAALEERAQQLRRFLFHAGGVSEPAAGGAVVDDAAPRGTWTSVRILQLVPGVAEAPDRLRRALVAP